MRSELLTDLVETDSPQYDWPSVDGYELVRRIRYGSLCSLYLGKSIAAGTAHHITCVPVGQDEAESLGRFESAMAAQCLIEPHDGIEKILESGASPTFYFAISEPITGPTLTETIALEAVRPMEWALEMACKIAPALDFIASHNRLAHGGVTPDAIRFDPARGGYLLTNYLYSRLSNSHISAYSAPEIVAGAAPTPQSDVYGLGLVLYTCRVGRPPFYGDSDAVIANQIRTAPIPELLAEPAFVRNVLKKMTARLPQDRYRVAVDAIEDLKQQRSPEAEPLVDSKLAADPRVEFVELEPTGDLPNELVLPGEPGMADPYARNRNGGAAGKFRAGISAVLAVPGRILGSVIDAVSAPFGRRTPDGASSRSYRRPRTRSISEVRIRRVAVRVWRIGIRVVLAATTICFGHAIYITSQQQYAAVKASTGKPNLVIIRQRSPISEGDKIDAGDRPVIETGKLGGVLLAIGDFRVYLDANTSLQIRRLDIDRSGARTTLMDLKSGQISILAPGFFNPQSRFEISGGGVRVRVRNSRCRLIAGGDGLRVQVRNGAASVFAGKARTEVASGRQVWAGADGLQREAAVPEKSMEAIREQTGGVTTEPMWQPIADLYHQFEEKRLIPSANRLLEFLHFKPKSAPITVVIST